MSPSGGGASEASPVVGADGSVYMWLSQSGYPLVATDSDGVIQWQQDQSGSHAFMEARSPALTDDGAILFTQDDGLHLRDSNGDSMWSVPGVSPYAVIIGDDGSIYFRHAGFVWALESSGAVRFGTFASTAAYADNAMAVADDGTVFAGASGELLRLSPTGLLLSRTTVAGTPSPSIGPTGRVFAATSDETVVAFDAAGLLLWTNSPTDGADLHERVAVGADGAVYAIGGLTGTPHKLFVYAINPDGSPRWTYTQDQASGYGITLQAAPVVDPSGNVLVHWGRPYGFNSCASTLTAVSPTGSLLWSSSTGTSGANECTRSTPAVGADGSVYVGAGDGSFQAFTP